MQSVKVSLLDAGEEPAWDDFVEQSPSASFFHRSGWKRVVETAFAHKTFYLTAKKRTEICGVLPLTQVKSLLFGNALISNAFCISGGIASADETASEALTAEAIRIGRELKVKWIEFRSPAPSQAPWKVRSGLYFTFRHALAPDASAYFNTLPRERRRLVRVAQKNGLTSAVDEGVDRLHHIYADSVRQLGSPVFSKRYFVLLKEQFGPSCEVLSVLHRGEPIASVMSFYFRDQVIPYYGGGLSTARSLAGNDFMYWEVMRRACDRGVRIFDFGRSKIGTGAFDFKRNWGFKPEPLSYAFLPLTSQELPEINPLNPKYRLAINFWRRLPLPVTKVVGPMIVRSIG